MKILFLTPGCFDKGGISRYSRYQVTALRELFGDENIRVLSLLGPEQDSFEDPFRVQWHGEGNTKWQQIRFIAQTVWQIISWRPAVIHIAHVNFSGFAYVLAKIFGIKTVLNVYGLEVWSGLSTDAAYGLKNVDCVISDCHYTASYIEENNFRKKGSTTVIWDCVDLVRFNPGKIKGEIKLKYGIADKTDYFVILSLGRLSKTAAHKGYDRLITVFSMLVKKHNKARLVIAGKGDNKESYQEMVRKLGIADNVVFTGMVDDKDLPDLYRCASVFSLVSDRAKGRGEGIPLTPIEAMACGVPIIVGNHDGSQEAVVNNLNGSVIDPFDLDAHVKVFEELIHKAQLLEKKKEAAFNIAQTLFSFTNFKSKHKDFYSGIL